MFSNAHMHQELARARQNELMARARHDELVRQAVAAKAEAEPDEPPAAGRRRLAWLVRRPAAT
jgi:hypothetical protein